MAKKSDTTSTLDWVKKLDPELAALDRVPLLCSPASFSWEGFAERLKSTLQLKELHFHQETPYFERKADVLSHIKDEQITLGIQLQSISEPVYIIFSKAELVHFFCYLLGEPESADTLEEAYLEGFVTFLTAATFDALQTLMPQEEWSLRSLHSVELKEGNYLSLAIPLQVDSKITLYSRFAIPQDFYHPYRERYATALVGVDAVAKALELTMGLQVGMTTLKFHEWNSVKEGDFILLDQLTLLPGESKGKILLTLDSKPLFRAKVKTGAIKIIEPITHYEVESGMVQDEEEGAEPTDEEVEAYSEVEEEEQVVEEAISSEEEVEEEEEAPKEMKMAVSPFKKEEMSVQLVVEIGRMNITVDELTKLQVGNVLKLEVTPESGVDLIVRDKLVGRGELLLIGDHLGVRVLDLGKKSP